MKSPAVVVEKSGSRIRLRNIDHALEGCLVTEKEEIRYRLEPNRWTSVPDAVYNELKRKFADVQSFQVPDWEPGGEDSPSRRTNRTEGYQEYIMEFSGDRGE
jgi:hypothetical protein